MKEEINVFVASVLHEMLSLKISERITYLKILDILL